MCFSTGRGLESTEGAPNGRVAVARTSASGPDDSPEAPLVTDGKGGYDPSAPSEAGSMDSTTAALTPLSGSVPDWGPAGAERASPNGQFHGCGQPTVMAPGGLF